jgi:uncharacterized membrane protein
MNIVKTNIKTSEKILWVMFFGFMVLAFFDGLSGKIFNADPGLNPYYIIKITYPFIVIFYQVILFLGMKRGIGLLVLAASVGSIFEMIGLSQGVIFGGQYFYRDSIFSIGGLPISILIYWAVFIYSGWSVVSFLTNDEKTLRHIVFQSLLDGLAVMAIDIFMDPLQVKAGIWTWFGRGDYLNIPIGNFIGWFLVGSITGFIFRIFELKWPPNRSRDLRLHLMPIAGYAFLALYLLMIAIKLDMPQAAYLGFPVMIIWPAFCLKKLYKNICLRKISNL